MTTLLTEQLVGLNVAVTDKLDAISTIADLLLGEGKLHDRDGYIADVLAREALIETGIGGEIAIPHAQSSWVASPAVAYLRLDTPVDWGESGPARHVFGIAVPLSNEDGVHLKILASLARRLLDDEVREILDRSDSKHEVLEALQIGSESGT